jgi:thiol-disulfide isomerase/thioredoxin
MRKKLALTLLLTGCLTSLTLWAKDNVKPPAGIVTLDGRIAPALALTNMDGQLTDIKTYKGKWILVHFWATWCGPCRHEMPTLQALQQSITRSDIKLILVNTAETDDEVFTFLPTVAPELNTLMDRDGLTTKRWQPRGLPSTYIIDPDDHLRYLVLGGRDWTSVEYRNFINTLPIASAR